MSTTSEAAYKKVAEKREEIHCLLISV